MNKRCTKCNSYLEYQIVDDRKTLTCKNCFCIEWGYTDDEAELVWDLQELFTENNRWRIAGVLSVFRKHYSKKYTPPIVKPPFDIPFDPQNDEDRG